MPHLTGKTLGNYQIIERVGKGGMATVYKAYQPALDRQVAVKVIHEQLASEDIEYVKRFQREAKVVASLRHPNIVQVFDYGVENNLPYMVMEYLDGHTLKAELQALAAKGQPMPFDEVRRIFEAVASAVAYAHSQGLIHRDIKPANIFLTHKGEVILTDFGIARVAGGTQYTASGVVIGTPDYMSPEQCQGAHGDARSDIYSLGIVLYEMLTGRVPFEADTPLSVIMKHVSEPPPPPRQINASIPEPVASVLMKTLAKEPDDRYPRVEEVMTALDSAFAKSSVSPLVAPVSSRTGGGQSIPVGRSAPKDARRPARKGILWVLGCAGLGALSLAGLAVVAVLIYSAAQLSKPAAPTLTAIPPYPGTLLLSDDFSDNKHAWDIGPNSDSFSDDEMTLADGKYRFSMASKQSVLWTEDVPNILLKNFWMSVDVTLVETSAESGDAGVSLIFRKDAEDNCYRIRFDNDGSYIVAMKSNGEWLTVQDWQYNDAIRLSPGVPNTFAVRMEGATITVYANGQTLGTLTDDTFSEAGKLAFGIGLDKGGDTFTVDFDNLIVTELP